MRPRVRFITVNSGLSCLVTCNVGFLCACDLSSARGRFAGAVSRRQSHHSAGNSRRHASLRLQTTRRQRARKTKPKPEVAARRDRNRKRVEPRDVPAGGVGVDRRVYRHELCDDESSGQQADRDAVACRTCCHFAHSQSQLHDVSR